VLLSRHHHLQQRSLALNTIDDQPTTKEPVTAMLAGKQLQLHTSSSTKTGTRQYYYSQDCLSIKGRLPANVCISLHSYLTFCSRVLDLNMTTLIYESDLDILKINLHAKSELSRSRLSKV